MALVTFQVLDGLERGEVFEDLEPPLTIGREDENDIRLNDERVSRFHAKIQEDDGHVILTDLESTNGTRVNGHPVQMHVLRIGDQILIGRCLLVYGSPEQLQERIEELQKTGEPFDEEGTVHSSSGAGSVASAMSDLPGDLFPDGPPPPPTGLTPLQRAQVADLLAFPHSNLTRIMLLSEANDTGELDKGMLIPGEAWHRLQQLQMQLAEGLKRINEP